MRGYTSSLIKPIRLSSFRLYPPNVDTHAYIERSLFTTPSREAPACSLSAFDVMHFFCYLLYMSWLADPQEDYLS